MPGFFSKLFRRKPASSVDDNHKKVTTTTTTTTSKKPNKRSKGKQDIPITNGGTVKPQTLGSTTNVSVGVGHAPAKPMASTTSISPSGSSGTREHSIHSRPEVETLSSSKQLSPRQVSPRVLSPRNQTADSVIKLSSAEKLANSTEKDRSVGPIDLDDESSHDENRNRKRTTPPELTSPRLSFQQLEQFNKQQHSSKSPNHISRPVYHMPMDERHRPQLSTSQREAMDDTNQSDASSSSFNLSTDAEDTEYEALKKGGVVPPLNASTLDTSAVSGVSCPTNYTTDEERAIFPALLTDDDATYNDKDSLAGARVPLAGVDDEPVRSNILPMPHESADDIRAWTLSPSTQASFKETVASASPQYSFNDHSANSFAQTNFSSPSLAASATPRRSFTTSMFPDDFADFADFDHVAFNPAPPDTRQQQQIETPKSHSASQRQRQRPSFLVEADFPMEHLSSTNNRRSSASAAHPDTTISDLLAQAKRTSRSSKSQKPSASSVNSAPAITAQYLRQHHNLRSVNGDRTDKTTSVSDIIQNLELTNASRVKSSSSRKSSHRSTGDLTDNLSNHSKDGTSASLRSAKDRFKEKRRKEREVNGSSTRKNRSRSSELDSSDPSDNEASESWLFDEVAGALGPRGVAADLESLSGRSNRSKSSTGNKSHRSHKSHRSQRSSRRRQGRSSSDSVESRGSKTSRNSRYSHRSTRSYISQMSEQSRSVANDLLRLEMQLAMVGSQENVEETQVRAGGSVASSVGGASRTSRTSRNSSATRRASALVRRSKVDVVAPAGKLGIILANKADSKGTVVSGVRTSSVLAEKISPGDRIVAIDGEDVSRMTVSEITTIMARKNDFERILTILTTPKHVMTAAAAGVSVVDAHTVRSPTTATDLDTSGYGYRR